MTSIIFTTKSLSKLDKKRNVTLWIDFWFSWTRLISDSCLKQTFLTSETCKWGNDKCPQVDAAVFITFRTIQWDAIVCPGGWGHCWVHWPQWCRDNWPLPGWPKSETGGCGLWPRSPGQYSYDSVNKITFSLVQLVKTWRSVWCFKHSDFSCKLWYIEMLFCLFQENRKKTSKKYYKKIIG